MSLTGCRIPRRWLVLAVAFGGVFLELGTMKSFGLFINDMTRDLQTTTAILGLAFGLSNGFSSILAIANIPLMKIFSARQLIIVGAVVASLGLMFSALSNSGEHFVWTMGIAGIGLSIVVFPAHTTATLDYFPDNFEKAVSVILTGGGLGMMLLPLLVEQLHEEYGWRGAMVILGALNLNYIVVGALMKPVKLQNQEGSRTTRATESKTAQEGYLEVTQVIGHDSNAVKESVNLQIPKVETSECNTLSGRRLLQAENEIKIVSDMDTVEHVLANELVYPRKSSIDQSPKEEGTTKSFPQEISRSATRFSVCSSIKNLFDVRLFAENPSFMFPFFFEFLFGITYTCWIIYVIPNAVAKGYTTAEGAFLATAGGAANIVGRLMIGFISSRDFVPVEMLSCILSLTAATAFFCNSFASSFWSLVVLAFMNGFASGAKIVMGSLLAKKSLPLEIVSNGMCYQFFSLGVGNPVGGALMGLLYDRTETFILAFKVAALVELISAVLILFPILIRWCNSKSR
ncbi:monocarboxylate transporter 14-like [Lytechinus variegatus]|uniref:monocarboxylate transporter 14-like n=1 Tax=Lytechinus variegatus TaxID=7654 RepID=UPI001BB10172|nr:monocarboxylate transporter 14-like [Lytechinus variegatus]XP_041452976.1 monocarboxylate transporter 14-like [Lytechinus variegatus]